MSGLYEQQARLDGAYRKHEGAKLNAAMLNLMGRTTDDVHAAHDIADYLMSADDRALLVEFRAGERP